MERTASIIQSLKSNWLLQINLRYRVSSFRLIVYHSYLKFYCVYSRRIVLYPDMLLKFEAIHTHVINK